MVIFCPAKINFGLRILRKRNDGYHDIESLFYPVPLNDVLEFVPSKELFFNTSGLKIPGNSEENLILKAYHLLKKEYELPPLDIHLLKKIPMGGGLGGGSSDAACFIKALNKYFELGMTQNTMREKAAVIGSDCAFFIASTAQYAEGKGEKLFPHPLHLKGYQLLLLFPGIHISTPEAYSGVEPYVSDTRLLEQIEAPVQDWKNHVINDFEPSIFKKHPELAGWKTKLYDSGAIYASMSGSGSTMFGLFEPGFDGNKIHFKVSHQWVELD